MSNDLPVLARRYADGGAESVAEVTEVGVAARVRNLLQGQAG